MTVLGVGAEGCTMFITGDDVGISHDGCCMVLLVIDAYRENSISIIALSNGGVVARVLGVVLYLQCNEK